MKLSGSYQDNLGKRFRRETYRSDSHSYVYRGRESWLYTSKSRDEPDILSRHKLDYDDWYEVDENNKRIKKGNDMRKDVNFVGGEYKVVEVNFDNLDGTDFNLNTYNYKCDIDLKVKEGSLVVVESSTGLGLARVVRVIENTVDNADEVSKATAWVCDKVSMKRQNARRDATTKRAYIIKQLEEKKAQMETVNMYDLLAQSDPEAAKLVNELKAIGN